MDGFVVKKEEGGGIGLIGRIGQIGRMRKGEEKEREGE